MEMSFQFISSMQFSSHAKQNCEHFFLQLYISFWKYSLWDSQSKSTATRSPFQKPHI